MNDSTAIPVISLEEPKRQRRWPGVVFSMMIPGFGLFRAGVWRRGIVWMLLMYGVSVAGAVLFVISGVPVWIGLAIVPLQVLLWIVMLRDCFRPGRMTWRLWVLFVVLIAVVACRPDAKTWLGKTAIVCFGAMEPTLKGRKEGQTPDYIVVDKLSNRFSKPQRGDLVVFSSAGISEFKDENQYIMRIVGLPGERIEIKDRAVYIDGRRLTEEDGIPPFEYFPAHSQYPSEPALKKGGLFVVGDGEYFVLGDNSANSFDSRYWGGVPAVNIIGKVSKIYYPFNRMGRVR